MPNWPDPSGNLWKKDVDWKRYFKSYDEKKNKAVAEVGQGSGERTR